MQTNCRTSYFGKSDKKVEEFLNKQFFFICIYIENKTFKLHNNMKLKSGWKNYFTSYFASNLKFSYTLYYTSGRVSKYFNYRVFLEYAMQCIKNMYFQNIMKVYIVRIENYRQYIGYKDISIKFEFEVPLELHSLLSPTI